MKRVEKLPAAFTLFEKMLGVLDFGVFEDAEGSEEEILSAIRQVLHAAFSFDPHRLRSLGCRRITEQVFFGDWYDSASGSLRRLGSYRTADGVDLTNPTFKELSQLQIVAGAIDMPEAGSGGEFAYAFVETPYGIKGSPQEIQAVFEEIRDFILPPQQVNEISD